MSTTASHPIATATVATPQTEAAFSCSSGDEPELGKYFVCAYPPFGLWKPDVVDAARSALSSETKSSEALGLYVHFPFCVRRCDYCYYKSFADSTHSDRERYLDFLDRELALYAEMSAVAGRKIQFAYFGGGTPSLLTADQIRKLLDSVKRYFPWDDVEEVTFECAPDSVHSEKLDVLKHGGVTRISLGVQQFDDRVLEANGRVHRVQSIERAYRAIRERAFPTVNIDLMVGLLGETDATFQRSIERTLAFEPESVTIYQLEIPHNTPLYRAVQDKTAAAALAPWDVKHQRLGAAMRCLIDSGYSLRSAYAAVRDLERDQFLYQDAQYRGADLLGLGVASFSYFGGVHYQNASSVDEYYAPLGRGELPIERAYVLTREEQMAREFLLQLKLVRVSREYFRRKFSVDIIARFSPALQEFRRQGMLTWDDRTLSVTMAGLPRVDRMIRAMYLPAHA